MAGKHKLTAKAVEAAKADGRYSDGGGLYLVVRGPSRKWALRYTIRGAKREMGLGAYPAVTLAMARERAAEARAKVTDGIDPISARDTAAAVPTFSQLAETVIADLSPGWKHARMGQRWRSSFRMHCKRILNMPVSEITTADILAVLRPIWHKLQTADAIRGRIERVLAVARVNGWRPDNPATWRGHLSVVLPSPTAGKTGHYGAMHHADLPAFMAQLADMPGIAALALRFTILTAARTGEVRGATWAEIDLDAAVWSIPGSRMKAGRPHRVPLSRQAVAVLRTCKDFLQVGNSTPIDMVNQVAEKRLKSADDRRIRNDLFGISEKLIFPGARPGRPLANTALEMLLRRMGVKPPGGAGKGTSGVTVHGFRSTFRDWAGDETDHAREVIEAALAHAVGDATERAYRRGDALDKRRLLMQDWADFCDGGA